MREHKTLKLAGSISNKRVRYGPTPQHNAFCDAREEI